MNGEIGRLFLLEGMTMRYFMGTLLAAGLVFAGNGVSRATDVVRLGGPAAQEAISGGTNTELARGRGGYHGGYHGGGYRGGYHGGYRGYYGGYRGYYGGHYGRGYYRPYYSGYYGGYYRPYYYSSYYSPYYYSSYYTPYYYPTVTYSAPYYYPCATTVSPVASVQPSTVYSQGPTYVRPNAPAPRPAGPVMPAAPQDSGTFPYDGGPKNPLPMPMPNPGDAPNPMKAGPRPTIPLDGKLVSLPTEAIGGSSPVAHDVQRLHYVSLTNTSASPAPARAAYPAYGEQPIPSAPRKTGTR